MSTSESPDGASPGGADSLDEVKERLRQRRKSKGGGSFADSLAARDDRSLTEMYRIEPEIPDKIIEWSVSTPSLCTVTYVFALLSMQIGMACA